jgi:glucose/arabinose dehydrogenase
MVVLAMGLLGACVAESEVVDSTATTAPPGALGPATTVQGVPVAGLESVHIELVDVVDGLTDPVALTGRSGTPNLYVAERGGRVRVIERKVKVDTKTGFTSIASESLGSRTVLDLSDDLRRDNTDQGLLGIAFSSDGSKLYAGFTDETGSLVVSEFEMRPLEDRADSSGRELLRLEQPAPNHNGGFLVFGTDGFLYIGVGDGGGEDDPFGTAQNRDEPLGSILRIDPDVLMVGDDPPPYAVPSGNPFLDGDDLPEIWLYGVQDPWRFSFDADTGDLWVADTGGTRREEITLLRARNGAGRGANLGWDLLEGTERTGDGDVPADVRAPIHEYDHSLGCRVVGGVVYRDDVIAELNGVYVFGDRCTGELSGIKTGENDAVEVRGLNVGVGRDQLVGFGTDNDRQVYVLAADGRVLRVVEGGAADPAAEDGAEPG